MSFLLNSEQKMIQSTARDFAKKIILPGSSERDQKKNFSHDIFFKMAEVGFMGAMVPENYGGSGLDTVSYVLALTEIAYACASTSVVMSVHNSICCEALINFASENQKQKWLPKMCTGDCIGAFALTEPQSGSDPAGQKTTAKKDGKYWILNGTKQFITSGKNAGLIIVTALTDKNQKHHGISAFLVPQGTPGLIIGKEEDKMGLRASDTVQLIFEECRIPIENILGTPGKGFNIAMSCLDCGRIGIAAQALGIAQACLDESINYMHNRKSFGQFLTEFQGLRWKIADMAVQIEAAKLLILNAAKLKDSGKQITQNASIAKLFSTEMVNKLAGEALQIHGGYGYCSDYPIERHYRDARVLTIYEGTSEIQRLIISKNLLKN